LEVFETLKGGTNLHVAVRSSVTAEGLPEASFAGIHESYLNIESEAELFESFFNCYVSLFTDRAIKYREDNGFENINLTESKLKKRRSFLFDTLRCIKSGPSLLIY